MLIILHNSQTVVSPTELDWEINYRHRLVTGNLPVSSYYRNITFWSDPATTLQRSNDTHNVNIDFGEVLD